jgi:hypothetical protein
MVHLLKALTGVDIATMPDRIAEEPEHTGKIAIPPFN